MFRKIKKVYRIACIACVETKNNDRYLPDDRYLETHNRLTCTLKKKGKTYEKSIF